MVGVTGFEPMASWSRTKRDTKLRHTPECFKNYILLSRKLQELFLINSCVAQIYSAPSKQGSRIAGSLWLLLSVSVLFFECSFGFVPFLSGEGIEL